MVCSALSPKKQQGRADPLNVGYEERAGLLEYDGGLARDEAEREAWLCLEEWFREPQS